MTWDQRAKGSHVESVKVLVTYKLSMPTLRKNKSLNTTLSNKDKKEETDSEYEDETDINETMAFNSIVDLKDTSLHDDDSSNSVSNDDSLSSDKEVFYVELQNKYDVMYNGWIALVEINKKLKKFLQVIKDKKRGTWEEKL